jgi:hypothetical protein
MACRNSPRVIRRSASGKSRATARRGAPGIGSKSSGRAAGTEVIVGAYGDWRSQLKAKIDVDWKGISAEERAELNARMRQQEEAEREKREERASQCGEPREDAIPR